MTTMLSTGGLATNVWYEEVPGLNIRAYLWHPKLR